jgi:mannosyltransferase OCH1-like enzyme
MKNTLTPQTPPPPLPNQLPKNKFPLKESYQSIIPLNIYQTWHTKNLPPHMTQCVNNLKNANPEFTHHLYDDNDCRDFIQKHFSPEIFNAYERILPGAYKADMWRYCVLYIEGGIYLDIKFNCCNQFKLIALTEREHFVNDINPNNDPIELTGVFNALLVCLPGNPILKKCIDQIVHNVNHRFFGNNCLAPTGPFLLKRFFSKIDRNNLKLKFFGYDTLTTPLRGIHFKGIKILDVYDTYVRERRKFSKTNHYGAMWRNRNIYK